MIHKHLLQTMNVYKPRYYWHRGKGFESSTKDVPLTRKMRFANTDGEERTEGEVQEVDVAVRGEAGGSSGKHGEGMGTKIVKKALSFMIQLVLFLIIFLIWHELLKLFP